MKTFLIPVVLLAGIAASASLRAQAPADLIDVGSPPRGLVMIRLA